MEIESTLLLKMLQLFNQRNFEEAPNLWIKLVE